MTTHPLPTDTAGGVKHMPRRYVGGSLLPSNSREILSPIETAQGRLQVRVIPEEDTHGLFNATDGALLAKHPNGFSCHLLATRIRDGSDADAQADYIVHCGGLVTDAGRAAIAKATRSAS